MPENDDMVLLSSRLRDLARDLARLAPSRTNPHRYFEQKSELVADLRDLARRPAAAD
jgi:hypothetical protein